MSSRRLPFALALSVLLHAAVIGLPGIEFGGEPDPLPLPLEVRLVPFAPESFADREDSLLKDTLTEESERRAPSAPTLDIVPLHRHPGTAPPADIDQRSGRHKPAQRRFYPPDAAAQGIEGEVRLRLTFDAEGKVVEVQIAASSGNAELDQAALRAVHALGRLPDIGVREMILPVVFRLQ